MTRNSSDILPFCEFCGEYKGLGPCKNPRCNAKLKIGVSGRQQSNKCIICGADSSLACQRCGAGYCTTHSEGMESTLLDDLNQHLGTCSTCGLVICEQCWILNQKGKITCLEHLIKGNHRD